MLLAIGNLVFDLRTNLDKYSRDTARDFARKDVVGARRPFEDVGPGDDVMTFSGSLFPGKIGSMATLDALRAIQQTAEPQMVVRGDGYILGWFIVTKIGERGEYLNSAGVPQHVEMEITCERCDQPSQASAFAALISLLS